MSLVAETAAALLIGNELLSGKVEEANLKPLTGLLRALGIRLVRAVFVPDEVDVIAREVTAMRALADVVITSGGVGPTHDDVTVDGVARSFGVDAMRDPNLEALLREVYGERCTEAHLRMALVPKGAELLSTPDVKWPTPRMGNVILLPGVPELFRAKLDIVRAHLSGPAPFITRSVFLRLDEVEVTSALDAVVAAHPAVELGSYPKWFDANYKTKITFDGRDAAAVELAVQDFVTRVAAEGIARVD
jgi:molybdenum cofactor synthesis domain-containing protein